MAVVTLLRSLAVRILGIKSWAFGRTYGGIIYASFVLECLHLGLTTREGESTPYSDRLSGRVVGKGIHETIEVVMLLAS